MSRGYKKITNEAELTPGVIVEMTNSKNQYLIIDYKDEKNIYIAPVKIVESGYLTGEWCFKGTFVNEYKVGEVSQGKLQLVGELLRRLHGFE